MNPLSRITEHQAAEVERLRGIGRTDRQIETMLGLTYGLLSSRYVVGDDGRPIMDRDPFGSGWRYPAKSTEGEG